MYCLSDEQVEYILSDIRRNGVEMEDLQLNLLDHICCIVEQNLEEDGDFEGFYRETVKQFYKHELREIEVETIRLLTFKNYYGMKKVMIVSGAASAVAFIFGSVFKVMHWPGAAVLLTLAILILGLVFLPLLTLLKTREGGTTRDKIVLVLGAVIGILFFIATLFKIMHWPGANVMLISTMGLSMFVLVPVYFFTGIRKPETKVNTIVTTVLLVGITALSFMLFNLRQPRLQLMDAYAKNEQLLRQMQSRALRTDNALVNDMNTICKNIKAMILQQDIGTAELPVDAKGIYVQEEAMWRYPSIRVIPSMLAKLKADMEAYNSNEANGVKLPADHILLNIGPEELRSYSNFFVLNNITQLQMYLANAESSTVAINR